MHLLRLAAQTSDLGDLKPNLPFVPSLSLVPSTVGLVLTQRGSAAPAAQSHSRSPLITRSVACHKPRFACLRVSLSAGLQLDLPVQTDGPGHLYVVEWNATRSWQPWQFASSCRHLQPLSPPPRFDSIVNRNKRKQQQQRKRSAAWHWSTT